MANISERFSLKGKAVVKRPPKKVVQEELYIDHNSDLYETELTTEPAPTLLSLLVQHNYILGSALDSEFQRVPIAEEVVAELELDIDLEALASNSVLNIVNIDNALLTNTGTGLQTDDFNTLVEEVNATRVRVPILGDTDTDDAIVANLIEVIDNTYPDYKEEIIGMTQTYEIEAIDEMLQNLFTNNVPFSTWYWNIVTFDYYSKSRALKSEFYRNEQIVIKGTICPRCKGDNTTGGTKQVGAGDEGFGSFYTCLDCGFKWGNR